jgi:hypothetical protein
MSTLFTPPPSPRPANAAPDAHVVGAFVKNSRESVVGSLSTHGGCAFASLQVMVPTARGGCAYVPKGLTISVDQLPALRQLVTALEAAWTAGETGCEAGGDTDASDRSGRAAA